METGRAGEGKGSAGFPEGGIVRNGDGNTNIVIVDKKGCGRSPFLRPGTIPQMCGGSGKKPALCNKDKT